MSFVGVLSAGALALILWYGGKLVYDKKITTGLLASFLMYTLQVAMAFAFLSSLYGDFMQVSNISLSCYLGCIIDGRIIFIRRWVRRNESLKFLTKSLL